MLRAKQPLRGGSQPLPRVPAQGQRTECRGQGRHREAHRGLPGVDGCRRLRPSQKLQRRPTRARPRHPSWCRPRRPRSRRQSRQRPSRLTWPAPHSPRQFLGAACASRALPAAWLAWPRSEPASTTTPRPNPIRTRFPNQTIPNPSDESAGKHAQTMQWVFYSVGAAAIATGTVLYVLGWPSATRCHARSCQHFARCLAPGLAGISAQGAF
jgi:hypothetical protein